MKCCKRKLRGKVQRGKRVTKQSLTRWLPIWAASISDDSKSVTHFYGWSNVGEMQKKFASGNECLTQVLRPGNLNICKHFTISRLASMATVTVPGILNPNTGGKNLYGELSVHIHAPILNSDSNVQVQYAWGVYYHDHNLSPIYSRQE